MHALILAAGRGSRLGSLTYDKPKPLISVGGTPMLQRLLRQFIGYGVDELTIVVGHHENQIRSAVEEVAGSIPVTFIHNPSYEKTNNAYSLWLARDRLSGVDVLSEADIVMDDEVVYALLKEAPEASWAVRPFFNDQDGALLTMDAQRNLSSIRIVRPPTQWEPGGFKSMGLLRLSRSFGSRLSSWLDEEIVQRERTDRYYDLVIAEHLNEGAPSLFVCSRGFWSEIDTVDDLKHAEVAVGGRG